MITTATFLGYLFLGFFIAYLVGFFINGLFSIFKQIR